MKYIFVIFLIIKINSECTTTADELCQWCYLDVCAKCYVSYYSIPDKKCKLPSTTIQNCKYYSSDTKCTECLCGFYLKDNKCPIIPTENCQHAKDETGECHTCSEGKLLDLNTKKCTDKYCKTENCRDCKPNLAFEECIKCDSGYRVDQISIMQGFKCTKTEDKCAKQNWIFDVCDSCLDGYYMIGTKCEKSTLIPEFIVYEDKEDSTFSLFLNGFLLITYFI